MRRTFEIPGRQQKMTDFDLHRTAIWMLFLCNAHNSCLATTFSCTLSISARCHGRAEIHCNATNTIQNVHMSKDNKAICNISMTAPHVSNDERLNRTITRCNSNQLNSRIWVEVLSKLPPDTSTATVHISNISLSDKVYQLFISAEGGHMDPKNIFLNVTGFCVPQISLNLQKTEIVCRVKGTGQDGLLEWSDDNKETWGVKEAHRTPDVNTTEDNIIILTSIIKVDPSSTKTYCCRVSYNEKQESPSEPVCLRLSEEASPSRFYGDRPERILRILVPVMVPLMSFSLLLAFFWLKRKPAVPPNRERTLSETPLVE